VYTGVCLMGSSKSRSFYVQTDVTCYALSDEEIWEYIETKDPFDKAGGYGIQGSFGVHIEKIHGDYNNVVGLPVSRLYQELKQY
ncbi:MAG: Maf family protein, partial [Lachnospiraceae bacterium]|nr:Maf family protein [Lachnospiraceae bacterium]